MKRNTFYLLVFIFIMLFTALMCYISTDKEPVYTIKFHESSITDTLKDEAAVEYILDKYEEDIIDEPFTIYRDGVIIHNIE